MNRNRNVCPGQVKLASGLLMMYLIFGVSKAVVGHHPPTNLIVVAAFTSVLSPIIICIWLIFRGTNWARWLFLAWFVWNYLFSPWGLQHFSPSHAINAIFPAVQLLLQLVALSLLFLPNSNHWFQGCTEIEVPR